MRTKFTWDDQKAEANFRKHGVSFEAAEEVFTDPNHLVAQNYFKDGEQREHILGMTRGSTLLLAVFVDRNNKDEEIIRIISARRAVASEQSIYADQNKSN